MSAQDNKNNFQYASMTPSVSSILNLPTVQDKKKPVGKVAGLSMGLAVNKPQTFKSPVGIIKLKESSATTTTITSGENKNVKVSVDVNLNLNTNVNVDDSQEKEQHKHKNKQIDLKIKSKASGSQSTSTKIQKNKSRASTSENKQKIEINHFDPAHWRLFVGNLGPEVTESLLLTTFQNSYPSTSRVLLVKDWKTQKAKGYGFVAFAEGKEFLRALKEMQGKWIGNRQCIIKKSEHQPTPSTTTMNTIK